MTASSAETLLLACRARQKEIETFCKQVLYPKITNPKIVKTRHFREWWRVPMNYVRIMELSLTLELLDLAPAHHVVDISSPRLLSLFLALQKYKNLHITDIENYFLKDFEVYKKEFQFSAALEVFDAQKMPYENASIDRIFSISVLEHLPEEGDAAIVKEAARVLKPGGKLVITLPAAPTYLEEWQKEKTFYWPSVQNAKGEHFLQRRYDGVSLEKRFANLGLEMETPVFVAEHPIKPPQMNENGMWLHNAYYLMETEAYRQASKPWAKLKPMSLYKVEREYSEKSHYLTTDSTDKNIRQVAVKFIKP